MSRRRPRNDSTFDLIYDIAALLPWQAGVALAVVAYVALHWYAGTPASVVDAKNAGTVVTHIVSEVARQVAGVFQYLLPGVFLLGASVSAFKRSRRQSLLARVAADAGSAEIAKLSWADFESLVAESYRQKGYRVVERGGAGPDGGVDLELYMGKDKYLVQCKHWRTYQVGVAVVRELYGVMAAEGAVGGYVVASGEFTADAQAFAEGRAIHLVDARKLKKLVGAPAASATEKPQALTAPKCPVCSSVMVARPVKRGPKAGSWFWGCPQYPRCRGTRQ